ncbi:unnamed protein product [Cuscuta europaea]|uniref:Uncharacterized protein n=1 Tax=Cuscuta europaea TaxID=41803 RepID=A0A9P1EEE2_CUSEU|nr:unnamed protein product [Cuscuta europaea]
MEGNLKGKHEQSQSYKKNEKQGGVGLPKSDDARTSSSEPGEQKRRRTWDAHEQDCRSIQRRRPWLLMNKKREGRGRLKHPNPPKPMKIWCFLKIKVIFNFRVVFFHVDFCFGHHVFLFVLVFIHAKTLEHKTSDGEPSLPVNGSGKSSSGSANLVASLQVASSNSDSKANGGH